MDQLGTYWAEHWVLAMLVLGAIAFIAGFVDSIAGGGGLFLVPGFLLVGLPAQVALGQEKLVSTLGTLAAIRNFLVNSKMVWKVALVGVPFSLLGAYLGAHLIVSISQETVGKIILALIPFAILIFLTPKDRPVQELVLSDAMLFTVVPLTCLVIGFYDGFFGPGTGSLFIIAFHYLLKMDLVSSSANSKTFNFASNIGALVAFVMAGKVLYLLALPLVACNILGNHLGSSLAIRKGSDVVRKVLVLSMLCLFASLGVKYLT
ncbi:TSUP family transporter [Pseudomonas sp. SBB6]|uniref:sulfite exporter TauE/SafE family protein n=1 Tax=Pseudomonas sp. SBB6 TaxID=2962032 RepID=UPI0020B6C30C|nr:TSUP family transporter [Pseudomonas sp. SBB6]MCP3751866.1 TSUP family transporter [Pseudomonas sp. SBB6]